MNGIDIFCKCTYDGIMVARYVNVIAGLPVL